MSAKVNKIQRVELCCSILVLHCPFCGSVVFDTDPVEGNGFSPCSHTLFIGDDNGLTYRSQRFDSLMQITGVPERDIEYGDGHTDGFTDRVLCPASLKFAIYILEPSGFAFYIGFAPNESDVLE